MWHALLAPEIENGNQRTFLAIFHLTRKSVFWPLWVGGVPERGGNMEIICHSLGYMPLKYLWLTPKTSKDIQNQKWQIFFSGHGIEEWGNF